MLFSTSISKSVFELFAPLSTGGKAIVVDNALALLKRGDEGDVTLVNTVPSAAQELVRGNGFPASVKTVCLAGEPLPATLAESIYRIPTIERLFNLYGPTEDTTYSTFAHVERDGPRGSGVRSKTAAPMCSTRGWSRCRSVSAARCTWRARGWRGDI